MGIRIALAAAFILGTIGVAQAQNSGGIEWNIAEYTLEDTSGNTLGYLYVPGSKHAQAGEGIWVWDGTPWDETFEMTYTGSVTAYSVPSGWTEETFENGDLTSGGVPGGTLDYNWKVTGGADAIYVDYSTSGMGWWSLGGITRLSQTVTYTFTAVTDTVSSSIVATAIENDDI